MPETAKDCSVVTEGASPEEVAAVASSVQVPGPLRLTVAEPAEPATTEHAPGLLAPSTVIVTVPGMSGARRRWWPRPWRGTCRPPAPGRAGNW